MLESKIIPWLGMMFPLLFSAGPANVAMASLGARFGLRAALPFIAGINLVVFLHALAIGLGADQLLQRYPLLFKYFQYCGAAYMIYLASKLFRVARLSAKEATGAAPTFLDGVILQSLNMKVITVTIVMFSHFLDAESDAWPQILLLSVGIATLTTGATLTWAASGSWLTRMFASERSVQWQGYLFGGMLLGVSVWMLM